MTETPEITIYGTSWCGGSRRARRLFDSHQIPYRWVDIDLDPEAAKLVEKINRGYRSVPTLVWKDGSTLTEPSEEELARKLGIKLG